mmetsp:Transcript_22510/g.62680  ORF Transcript_22510/g.62680 Transcript_22510/m.62680 type:complete len:419 (+) Transcript_22510:346-1602(+)
MDIELGGGLPRSESMAYPRYHRGFLAKLQLFVRQHTMAVFATVGFLGFVLLVSSDYLHDFGFGVHGDLNGSSFGGSLHRGYFSVAGSKIGEGQFRFAAVTDLDQLSFMKGERKPSYRSLLLPGTISYNANSNTYSMVMEEGATRTLVTKHNEAGRGAEFSELTIFDNRLLTFDDRTGDVFEIMNKKDGTDSYVAPRYVVSEGEGDTDKGMKWEWSTVKDGLLYIGSMGKEYTNKDGSIANVNNLWITIMDTHGEFKRVNWTEKYNFIRKVLHCENPGYLIHEAIRWSPHMRKWVFMPRRVSEKVYDDVLDEKRGSNKVVIVDESFTSAQVVEVQMADKDGLHGFSSFAFVPETNDRHAIALRSVEEDCAGDDLDVCKQRSYIVIFDVVTGEVLMDEVKIKENMKFEGIEFVNMFTQPV